MPGVVSNDPDRHLKGSLKDFPANIFVVWKVKGVQNWHGPYVGHPATGYDAFLDGCPSGGQCVFHPGFPFLELRLSGGANFYHGNTTREFCQPFLQFFLVVFGGRFFDLNLDLLGTPLDVVRCAAAIDYGRVILGGFDPPCLSEVGNGGLIESAAGFLGNHLASGENSYVF